MEEPVDQVLDAPLQERLLCELLAHTDQACPRCGYLLRGLRRPYCPECGDELRLTIALAEPRLAGYIALLAAWSVGLGSSGLFGAIALLEAPSHWWSSLCGRLLMTLLLLSAASLAATIIGRRRIRRLPPRTQLMLALLSGALVLAFALGIVVTFDG